MTIEELRALTDDVLKSMRNMAVDKETPCDERRKTATMLLYHAREAAKSRSTSIVDPPPDTGRKTS